MEKEQISVVVGVVKDQEGKILVARRREPDIPDADGKWEFVGGHIEFLESPEDAIIREAKEESGLDVRVVRLLPKIYQNHWASKQGRESHVLLISYECEVTGGKLHTENFDEKISELKFIDIGELKDLDVLPMTNEIATLLNL